MTTKVIQLKKRLIKYAVIFAVVAALFGAGAYEVSDYDDQMQAEKQRKDGENAKLQSDTRQMQQQIDSTSETNAFYNHYVKNHNSNLLLNREAATGLLASLREKNHLANLAVTVSPITNVTGNTLALKTGSLIQSEVKLSFNALTDNSVYGFIEAMQRELPGIVLVHDLKITKTGELSGNILRDLSVHKIDPLVTVELTFAWLGIRENDTETQNSGSPPSGHNMIQRLGRNPQHVP